MAPIKKSTPPAPKPVLAGFPVVIGPRSLLHRYWGRPWAEVLEAARAGRDGLRADTAGSPTAALAFEEFSLREMDVTPLSVFHGYPGLLEQRW